MLVINVIVTRYGTVQKSIAIITNLEGTVVFGNYKGRKGSKVAEEIFLKECREINDQFDSDNDEDDKQNYLDDGVYESRHQTVFLNHAEMS
jgi:hypothetical protein